MKKDRQRGHALELHVGRLLGGRRRRNGEGIVYDDCVNVDGSVLPVSVEAKSYARLQLQTKWIEQAKRNCGGRPWAVVQRPLNSKTIYATVDLNWLIELCTKAGLIHHQTEESHADRECHCGSGIDPCGTDSPADRTLDQPEP